MVTFYKDVMEIVLVLWSMGLALWTLYIFLASIAWQKRRSAFYAERMRWQARADQARRDRS